MSEKKVIYEANVVSFPLLKMDSGEVPSPNPGNFSHRQVGPEIKLPGFEMETAVTKLITHLKKNNT